MDKKVKGEVFVYMQHWILPLAKVHETLECFFFRTCSFSFAILIIASLEKGLVCQSLEDLHLIREGFDFDRVLHYDINNLTFHHPPLSLTASPPPLAAFT